MRSGPLCIVDFATLIFLLLTRLPLRLPHCVLITLSSYDSCVSISFCVSLCAFCVCLSSCCVIFWLAMSVLPTCTHHTLTDWTLCGLSFPSEYDTTQKCDTKETSCRASVIWIVSRQALGVLLHGLSGDWKTRRLNPPSRAEADVESHGLACFGHALTPRSEARTLNRSKPLRPQKCSTLRTANSTGRGWSILSLAGLVADIMCYLATEPAQSSWHSQDPTGGQDSSGCHYGSDTDAALSPICRATVVALWHSSWDEIESCCRLLWLGDPK